MLLRKLLIALTGVLIATSSEAVELKVMSSIGIKSVLEELAPKFERRAGDTLVITYGTAKGLAAKISAGEPFDVAILTAPIMHELVEQGRVLVDTRTDIARSGIGIAVRAGEPKPDIGSVTAFTEAIRRAPSIAYAQDGASGAHFLKVLEKLEIKNAKLVPVPGGTELQRVAKGDAALAVQLISEILAAENVELVDAFPPALQSYVVFTAAVATNRTAPTTALDLINYLRSLTAIMIIRDKGMEQP